MQIEARGLIYDATDRPSEERIAYFTSLCRLGSGTLLAGFQLGPGKHAPTGTLGLCRSRDGGETWTRIPWRFETTLDGVPGSLAMAEMVESAPGRLLLFTTWFDRSEPERPLFDPETEGILHSRQLLAVSTDDGETWGPWRALDTAGLTGCAGTGPAIRWPDGTLAFAFESFKEFDDPRPGRHAAWLLVSRDGGETFEAPVRVAQHPEHRLYYWDQRLCPAGDRGEFVALFWTHDLQEKRDLNVHFLRASLDGLPSPGQQAVRLSVETANSDVNREQARYPEGSRASASLRHRPEVSTALQWAPESVPRSWQPQETEIPGQIAAPLLLPDGRLLAFVVDRGRPGTLRLWLSHDGGETWPETEALVVHTHDERALLSQGSTDIDFKQYWEDMGKWSFGHPALRPLGHGRVLLAYYAGTPDCMSIHWARVAVDAASP